MADLNQQILDELRNLARALGGGGTRAYGATSTTASTGGKGSSGDMAEDLRNLGQQAKDVEANIKKLNRQFLPFTGSLEKAQKANQQLQSDINDINRRMEELDTALETGRYRNTEINDATRESLKAERDKLKVIKTSTDFESQKQATIKTTFTSLGGIADAYQKIALAAVAGMSQISAAVQAGGSGFNLLGAAAEYQADMAKAQADMGAGAMKTVGASMENLGAAGRLAGGALNFLAQAAEHNAQLRREAARIRNQLFMNMGDKFSKSFLTAGAAGAVFANGATGMNSAIAGSRILLQDLGEMVKRNTENFAKSGMSAEEMTKRIGATSASFKKSGLDQGLMRLGFDFQKQADIMAGVIGSMGEASAITGSRKASQAETDQATLNMAKSMSLIAAITGEDYETRKKQAQEEMRILSNQIENGKLIQKYGPTYATAIEQTTAAMSPAMKQAMTEMQASGGKLVSAAQNQMAAASPAYKRMMDELYQARMRGELNTAEDVARIEVKYRDQANKELMAKGAYANAATLGATSQVLQDGAKLMAGELTRGGQVTKEKLEQTTKNIENATTPPKPGAKPKDPLGDAIVGAAVTMNNFQKKMEQYVVDNIPVWSNAMQSALHDMEDAFKGVVAGLNPIADQFDWLTNFLSKYGILVMLAVQALPIFTSGLKLAKGGLDKLAALREMKSLKSEADKPRGKIVEAVDKRGQTYHHEEGNKMARRSKADFEAQSRMEAPGTPPKGRLARAGESLRGGASRAGEAIKGGAARAGEAIKNIGPAKLLGGALAVAQMAASAYEAYEVVGAKQKEYEAAKAAGDTEGMKAARAEQGGAVGSAAGSMAGGAIGFALGGPIGAAIGSFLGEKLGGFLGEKIGPYWDDMANKAGEMWESTKKTFTGMWDNTKKVVGDVLSTMGTGIMNVGKSVLSFLVDMGKTVFDGIMSFGKPIFAFFGKIGTFIWDAVKATPLFRIGTIIWDAIAKTDIGGKMVKMFTSVTDFLKEKLEGIWNWVKSSLTNLLPDWIKNKLGLGGGEEKPPPESKPAESKPPASKPAESKPPAKPSAGTAVPTAGPHGEPYIVMPDGRKGFGDVKSNVFYPLIGNQLGQAEKYNQAYARAATKGPSPTTDAPKQGNNTASKQGEGRQQSQTPSNAPPQASKQVTTAPEVKVGGNVTEKDIPRLMQEHVKLADYHAKTNAQMVNLLAGMAENAKRTAAATEKTARNT